MRLNRYLSACGFGSRRGVETLITEGRVKVNGQTTPNLGTQVEAGDTVLVNGREAKLERDMVIALHKPRGYVCTRDDEQDRRTIYDLLPPQFHTLHHIGRLDMDSSGLILLTNRGDISHQLTHPRHGVEKEYDVTTEEPFDETKVPKLVKGMMTPEGYAKAERAWLVNPTRLGMVLKQGLKRQIRHMIYQSGNEVERLVRIRIGTVLLKGMAEGSWRELSGAEVRRLMAPVVGKARKSESSAESSEFQKDRPRKSGPRGAARPEKRRGPR
jgi:23S rRNA pseudouridine2605 synthase